MNNLYVIEGSDRFDMKDFPAVKIELAVMQQELIYAPALNKADIIISFLKDHFIRKEWVLGNPALIKLMTAGFFPTVQVESLFQSCRHNKEFLHSYEAYIRSMY